MNTRSIPSLHLIKSRSFVSRCAVLLLVLTAVTAGALQAADHVVLKNGDRVTGTIIKKDGDTLTMESAHFGAITMPWAEVESVTSDTPLHVVLPGDKTVRGTLATQADEIQVKGPGEAATVTPEQIVAIRNDPEQTEYEKLLNPGLLDLWTVNGSLGIAGAEGNAETLTITTPINFSRISNSTTTTAYFNSIRSTATINGESERTANAIRGGWAHNRNLGSNMFINSFNDYEFDEFQSLDLRIVLGGGVGYHLWRGKRGQMDVVGGVAWNRETFNADPDPKFTRNSAEAYWGNNLGYDLNSRTTLTQAFRMFNNMSNSGEYRMNFDLGAATQLTEWLTWNVSLSDRFLSNPLPGRQSNDLLYSTGLGFSFGR